MSTESNEARYANLFADEDDIFIGSPESKYYDVIFNANRSVCECELTRQIRRQAAMEHFLAEYMGEDYSKKIDNFLRVETLELTSQVNNLYLECMGNVLTQSE